MNFSPTPLAGSFVIEVVPNVDERGHFTRLWCQQEFADYGLPTMVQASMSHTAQAGTVRGLHFQWPPSVEAKLVRCERGLIYDVIVDLRPASATFTQCFARELDGARRTAIFVPAGFAHGFQTLEPDCEVSYLMSDFYRSDLAGGVRPEDPAFRIAWPLPIRTISARDRDFPDFDRRTYMRRYAGDQQP